jgi:hypothetical protein
MDAPNMQGTCHCERVIWKLDTLPDLSLRVTVLFAAVMVSSGLTAISTMTSTYPAKQPVIEGAMVGQSIFISAEIAAALHTTWLRGQVRMGGTGRLLIYV